MELKKYLEGKDRYEFAKKIGTKRPYLDKLCCGTARPSVELAKRIEKATKGLVSWVEMLDRPKSKQ